MWRGARTVAVLAGAIGLGATGGALVFAAGTPVSGPATVSEVAERGEEQTAVRPRPAAPSATYRVVFDAEWTAATHPATLPSNAHFSRPVIAVHAAPGAMFSAGSTASSGIEQMAEVGTTSTLLAELGGTSGVTFAAAHSSGIPAPATSTRTFDITVSQSASLVSLVTMLAPSPDWFVGIGDVDTFVDGQWIGETTLAVGVYDAGTDSGAGFTSGNADTNPAQTISGPRDAAFTAAADENPFATITITRTG